MSAYDSTCDAVIFKHEDMVKRQSIGPVHVRRGGVWTPYKESGRKDWDGKPTPAWFSLADAKKIAKSLNLPFFEV
jgi:hypothetical protein